MKGELISSPFFITSKFTNITGKILKGVSMYIKNKKRVMSLDFLRPLENQTIRLAVQINETNLANAVRIGFSSSILSGETILPKKIGPVTRRNSEGNYIIHRDEPKETRFRTIEWRRKQWIGRGETEDVWSFVEIPYQRYPRTLVLPYSVELTAAIDAEENKYIVTPPLNCNLSKDADFVCHCLNLMIEIFGECHLLHEDLRQIITSKIIRLNWDILPPGEYPWGKRYLQLKPFIESAKPGNRSIIKRRIEVLNNYQPDVVAIGRNGFHGYIGFVFNSKAINIFESIYTDNATYIFDKNWKELSSLTKKEILTNNLHKDRIIHRKDFWEGEIDKLLRN